MIEALVENWIAVVSLAISSIGLVVAAWSNYKTNRLNDLYKEKTEKEIKHSKMADVHIITPLRENGIMYLRNSGEAVAKNIELFHETIKLIDAQKKLAGNLCIRPKESVRLILLPDDYNKVASLTARWEDDDGFQTLLINLEEPIQYNS